MLTVSGIFGRGYMW